MNAPHPYLIVVHQIEAADLPAAAYRMARRLLDIAAHRDGTFSLPRAQMREIAGTEADSTMRRHLIALSKAGIIEYRAKETVIVMFKKWHEMITTRSPGAKCSLSDLPRSLDDHGDVHQVISQDHSVNTEKNCSSDDLPRSLSDLPGSSDEQNGVSHNGFGWLVGNQLETDNQPTIGDELPQPPEPQPPANDPVLEALAVSLLIDPSVGISMPVAQELAHAFPFPEIRRQVFGWLPERREGAVKAGALISRIKKRWSMPDPDPEIDRTLWNRYRTPDERRADAEIQTELDAMLEAGHRRARASDPAPAPAPEPRHENPWAILVAEIGERFGAGVLERAQVETVGELKEAEVWQVTLAAEDAEVFGWMQRAGAVLIRKKLSSILGRAVLVDVILPQAVPA